MTKPVVAKLPNGTVQITFDIPWEKIESQFGLITQEMSKDITIPGFRKGKAPVSKVKQKISDETFIEKSLQKVLPRIFSDALTTNNINPAIYPKFEFIKGKKGETFTIRATTCEIPEINLGNYKSKIKSALVKKSKDIKNKDEQVLEILKSSIEFTVPEMLVEEEVNSRMIGLIQRLEKLGLDLDNYLNSIQKTPQRLREDYIKEAKDSLKLELLLRKIAIQEKIKASQKDIENFTKAASANPNFGTDLSKEERDRIISSIVTKRKVMDLLSSL